MRRSGFYGDDQDPESRPSGVDDRFRIILDSVNDGIFISDPATGQFIDINLPGCKMFGYSSAPNASRASEVRALKTGWWRFCGSNWLPTTQSFRTGSPLSRL
jgi:PAS domain-containing protein